MLQLVNLTKKYRDAVAVRGVDLTLQDGEFFALVGPSGSGKTSILAMVSGYIDPTSGSILQDGEELTRLPPAARNLGIVFQDYALFPHMTARNNVAYGLKRRHWGNRQEISKRVNEMLDVVGLVDLGERYPRELSGGQQQRVAIARALAYEPKLLLMDEPLGALDRAIREDMQRVIIDVHHQLKPTILYVTHNRGEAYAMADRVGVMRDGLMVAADAPTKLRMEPPNAFIASFFGGHNLLPIKITGSRPEGGLTVTFDQLEVESFPGQEGLRVDQDAFLMVPQDAFSLAPSGNTSHDGVTRIRTEVRGIVDYGAMVQLRCIPEGDTQSQIVFGVKGNQATGISIHDTVDVAIDAQRTRVLI